MDSYAKRTYLSTTEVASYLGIKVRNVQELIKLNKLSAVKSTSGQYRIDIKDVRVIEKRYKTTEKKSENKILKIDGNSTTQKIFFESSQKMKALNDNSIHLAVCCWQVALAATPLGPLGVRFRGESHNVRKYRKRLEGEAQLAVYLLYFRKCSVLPPLNICQSQCRQYCCSARLLICSNGLA